MKPKHIDGIDYLSAVMSIFVVVWHVKNADAALTSTAGENVNHSFSLFNFIDFNVLLLAIPSLIFISLFLYAFQDAELSQLKKRLSRLALLTIFWSIVLIRYNEGPGGLAILIPHSFEELVIVLFTSGYTIYYFFVSLIICLLLTYLISKLNKQVQFIGLVLALSLVFFLPKISALTNYFSLSAYWNPLNYLAFPFAAVLIAQNIEYVKSKRQVFIIASLLLSFLFMVYEWKFYVNNIFFPGQEYALPVYARNSLLFAIVAIFLILLDPRIRSNKFIKYLSKYSIALYCLHPFFILPAYSLINKLGIQNQVIGTSMTILVVLLYSYTLALLFKKYIFKKTVIL